MNKGLTIIELIVVVTIISLIGVSVSPFISGFLTRNNIESTSDNLVSSLVKAQSYAMDRKLGKPWGVCIQNGKIIVFSGACIAPVTSDDFSIPGNIIVSGISEVTFNTRGEPSTALDISLTSGADSVSIEMTAAGGLNIN